jgi:AcrR family transcriptional regulator
MALAAAREIVEADGLRGLTVRRIAGKIGYAGGTLYNLFENLDDLIVRLNGETLDALYQSLTAKPLDGDPEAAARDLAAGYTAFTRVHPKLWSLLFEHRLPDGKVLPAWYHEKIARLLGLVERALAPLFAPGREAERHHAARVLWSSLHGICSLETGGKLAVAGPAESLTESLIANYLAGLRHGAAHPGTP